MGSFRKDDFLRWCAVSHGGTLGGRMVNSECRLLDGVHGAPVSGERTCQVIDGGRGELRSRVLGDGFRVVLPDERRVSRGVLETCPRKDVFNVPEGRIKYSPAIYRWVWCAGGP